MVMTFTNAISIVSNRFQFPEGCLALAVPKQGFASHGSVNHKEFINSSMCKSIWNDPTLKEKTMRHNTNATHSSHTSLSHMEKQCQSR